MGLLHIVCKALAFFFFFLKAHVQAEALGRMCCGVAFSHLGICRGSFGSKTVEWVLRCNFSWAWIRISHWDRNQASDLDVFRRLKQHHGRQRQTEISFKNLRQNPYFSKMTVYSPIILLQIQKKWIFRVAALSFDSFFGQFRKKGVKIIHVINVGFNGETARNSKGD